MTTAAKLLNSKPDKHRNGDYLTEQIENLHTLKATSVLHVDSKTPNLTALQLNMDNVMDLIRSVMLHFPPLPEKQCRIANQLCFQKI